MKSILITGSSKGLGKKLALKFSKEGYNVIIHGREKKSLAEVKKRVERNSSICDIISGDLRDDKTIEDLYNIAVERDISILINNAGVMEKKEAHKYTKKLIHEVIDTNLTSLIILTTKIYQYMKERGHGMIININSTSGKKPDKYNSLYSASKYGLRGYTESLKLEAIENNIRIMGVYPGGMNTTLHNRSGGLEKGEITMSACEVARVVYDLTLPNTLNVSEVLLERMKKSDLSDKI